MKPKKILKTRLKVENLASNNERPRYNEVSVLKNSGIIVVDKFPNKPAVDKNT
jgi:hypothetical protein